MDKRVSDLERNVTSILFWKQSEITEKFKMLDMEIADTSKNLSDLSKQVFDNFKNKLNVKDFFKFQRFMEGQMANMDAKTSKQEDDVQTLEHYCERYIPLQVQTMIMENMKLVLTPKQMEILQGEENKLELKMQKQLMELGSTT